MIIPMKKVTVICQAQYQAATLDALREAGTVHVTPLRPPESDELEKMNKEIEQVDRAVGALPRSPQARSEALPAEQVVQRILTVLNERQQTAETCEFLLTEQKRLLPYGSFDPEAIGRLENQGIHVRLFKADPKEEVTVPSGVVVECLSRSKRAAYFVATGQVAFTPPGEELQLPSMSLSGLERNIEALKHDLAAKDASLEELAGHLPGLMTYREELADRRKWLQAHAGMDGSKSLLFLQGYSPEDAVEGLRRLAEEKGWGIVEDDPGSDEHVPTLVRNSKIVRMIEPIFKFMGIHPGYSEVDISPFFLVFFSLFFGMIVGDAGYGAIFLALTLVLRKRLLRVQPLVFPMMLVMSLCTVAWGALTGNYFGIAATVIPAPLAGLRIDWLNDENNLMFLCFLIGAVHLTIAHGWNVLRTLPSLQALSQAGWICITWTMFFGARSMILGAPFPGAIWRLFGLGVALILLFRTPFRNLKSEWFTFVVFPLDLVSSFVDVVSYVRLFAVGMATFAVASAFNEMALGIGFGSVPTAMGAALILFVGHIGNMALAGMGVLVHGIRLNALEFSGHLGMQWTGIPYEPFRKTSRADDAQG